MFYLAAHLARPFFPPSYAAYFHRLGFGKMSTSLPTGVYYVYYQPGDTQLFIMLDQNSQVPTVQPLSPGSQSQQWQVSGAGVDANARTLRNVKFGTYIGRSFIASQNGTLAVDTPVPWYMTSNAFGPGWWKSVLFSYQNSVSIYSMILIRIFFDQDVCKPQWHRTMVGDWAWRIWYPWGTPGAFHFQKYTFQLSL